MNMMDYIDLPETENAEDTSEDRVSKALDELLEALQDNVIEVSETQTDAEFLRNLGLSIACSSSFGERFGTVIHDRLNRIADRLEGDAE